MIILRRHIHYTTSTFCHNVNVILKRVWSSNIKSPTHLLCTSLWSSDWYWYSDSQFIFIWLLFILLEAIPHSLQSALIIFKVYIQYLKLLVSKPFTSHKMVKTIFLTPLSLTYQEHSQRHLPQTVRPHQESCESDKCRRRHLRVACCLWLLKRFWSGRETGEAEPGLCKDWGWHSLLSDSKTPENQLPQVRPYKSTISCEYTV